MTTQETERPQGEAGTSVNGEHATTHAGTGDVNRDSTVNRVAGDWNSQTNYYLSHSDVGSYSARLSLDAEGRVRYVKERRVVPGDRLVTLRGRFVAPDGFQEEECRADIVRHGAVVLSASPGDGARSAALMILAPRNAESDQDVRDDLVETGADGRPVLGVEPLEDGGRLLVDLTRESGVSPFSVRDELERLRVRGHRSAASLVVLVERGDEEGLPESLKDRVVPLNRPDPLAVLDRHLGSRDVPGFFPDRAAHDVRVWAGTASMGEIERVARRAAAARREAAGAGTIDDWLREALETGGPPPPENLEDTKGRARAILLAASLMEGALVEHLAVGVESLLSQISFPEDETPLLNRPGFQEELRLAGIVVGPERRVRFSRPGRGRALRSALWDAHPRLHSAFGQWVDTLMAAEPLSHADRDRVAKRWADQTLRIADPGAVFLRAEFWSVQQRRSAPQAALLLTKVLRHEKYGRAGRQFLYTKAQSATLTPGWGEVLVAVCAQELAETHPGQAVTRLHLLARNKETAVADAARAELGTLAMKAPLYLQLLRRVCERLHDHGSKPDWQHDTERDLLWDLADPDRIADVQRGRHDSCEVRRWLTEGLGALFRRERALTKTYAARWIGSGRPLMEVLVDASVLAGTLPPLYTAGLRWADGAATPEQRELHRADGELLVRMVDAAEGLGGRESSVAGTSTPAGTPRRENG
ncbi:hypothetical protein [Nocardiopsis prasina]|uniref:hypothetical protein n=1 Tax=Nocardiopsis prasina TaxID=2015 RepID=UPI000344F96E|nr:hypothetical protein [Nocardiopsis prasina]